MKAIYEKDGLYSSLRPVVDWCCRHSYRRFEMHGEENLPEDGALILAPNHTNTLMDALVMLRAHKGPTVFGARADIFKKPAIARIMHFCVFFRWCAKGTDFAMCSRTMRTRKP